MQATFDKEESSLTASNNGEENKPDPEIKCPFLRMFVPKARNTWQFTRDCQKNGMGFLAAFGITVGTVAFQKGVFALLRGDVPDLYKLDKVKFISHKDLYLPEIKFVEERVKALSRNGQVSLQDLADIKMSIAAKKGVSVIQGSKIQTVLLFLRAGGDLGSRLIDADDALRMIKGYEPKKSGVVTAWGMARGKTLINWKGN